MPFYRPAHPEADEPGLRALSWQQAAELAAMAPTIAAALLMRYEAAGDLPAAERAALELEACRAEHLSFLSRRDRDAEAAYLRERLGDPATLPALRSGYQARLSELENK